MAFIMKEMKMKIVYYKDSFNKNCIYIVFIYKVFPKRPDCGIFWDCIFKSSSSLDHALVHALLVFSCFLHRAFTNF